MTPLDLLLGERASAYLLGSVLLVVTLTTIAAIIDIPLRSLREAGFAPPAPEPLVSARLFSLVGLPATVVTFVGAAIQAALASRPEHVAGAGPLFFAVINGGFLLSVVLWALASPLARHWGLALVGFSLGLALIFPLLALILRLDFLTLGVLPYASQRLVFAGAVAAILCCTGACLASLLAMLAGVIRAALLLIRQHRLLAKPAEARPVQRGRRGEVVRRRR